MFRSLWLVGLWVGAVIGSVAAQPTAQTPPEIPFLPPVPAVSSDSTALEPDSVIPLPTYESLRDRLPSPVYDQKPLWVECYWKAWELACRHIYRPTLQNGFVSSFVDPAFSNHVFIWDMCFITLFCNYAQGLVPGIEGLDNFYVKQLPTGEISREIDRETGKSIWMASPAGRSLYSLRGWDPPVEFSWTAPGYPVEYLGREVPLPAPLLTMEGVSHPLLAWAEWESFRLNGDTARLQRVFEPLQRYYEAIDKYYRQGNGLYMTDWSSMDNSVRNIFLTQGGQGVDISAEMALFARTMAEIARVLDLGPREAYFRGEASRITRQMNALMWSSERQFYFDLTLEGGRSPIRSIAGFWPLLGGVPDADQAARMVEQLTDTAKFWRRNPVPTLSAEHARYSARGDYWNGAVWAPTNTMVIRGLERYGYDSLARLIALKHLDLVSEVYRQTGTIWENYQPDSLSYGWVELQEGVYRPVRRDFVGWSGIAPILYLLEYGIGLKADAPSRTLHWRLDADTRVGCERFRFGGIVTSLIAEPVEGGGYELQVSSDTPYTLELEGRVNRRVEVPKGTISLTLP